MLGLWGIESAFGDPDVQKNHMRPVIPALAALAWGEPRRRAYWEQELLNALVIIEHGWSTSEEMRGSWAGAMGHTQWMPEVWLNVGLDYDGDGRVSPFGKPDDALAGTAQYLVKRGKYPRGERTPMLAEVQEIQQRLTALGFDTGGTDGRVGNDTMLAVRNFQRKVGMQPADGYAGVKLLARLRQGP